MDPNEQVVAATEVEAAEVAEAAEAAEATEAAQAEESEFQQLKARLEEIATAVDDEEISLDSALDLYEEAVGLGLQAINLLDVDITAQEEAQARMLEEAAPADEGAQAQA